MLIEFSVANFRSLKDRQTLSLIKAKGTEHADNSFEVSAANSFELLRSAAIYGPNASGKTNFLNAVRTMTEIVTNSASNTQAGDSLPVVPFVLDPTTKIEPTEFEVSFVVENIRYQYGFATTKYRVHEEWLIAFPKGRAQRWFHRVWDAGNEEYRWLMGKQLQGEKQLWQKSTRANALFLSTAVQLNSAQLQPVYDWFKNRLKVSGVGGWAASFSASLCEDKSKKWEKNQVVSFLKAADLGIEDVVVESKMFDESVLPEDMDKGMKEQIMKDMKGKELLDIKTTHKTANGETVTLDFDDESDGTQRLFGFAGPWIDSLSKGNILFIDELHANLHPKLVQFLVELFHSNKTNPKNAQLVFTTHETSILNQEVFRRDQIWFYEKNSAQESGLYPLSDFSPKKGRENLELAYLSGRYGAVPYVSKFAPDFAATEKEVR